MTDDEILEGVLKDEKLCHRLIYENAVEELNKYNETLKLEDIGELFGIRKQYIAVLKDSALKKIKNNIKGKESYFKEYLFMIHQTSLDLQYKNNKRPTLEELDSYHEP